MLLNYIGYICHWQVEISNILLILLSCYKGCQTKISKCSVDDVEKIWKILQVEQDIFDPARYYEQL